MTLPSIFLQSTLVLSDPRCFTLFLCVLGGLGFCAFVGELGKDPG